MLAIPLYDDTPKLHMPLATTALVATCSLVFLWQIGLPPGAAERAIYSYGMIPAVIFGSAELPARLQVVPFWLTPITCHFMQAGSTHWAICSTSGSSGAEWKALGFSRYLLLYLAAGRGGADPGLMNPTGDVPMIGASGAIAGVLGAYPF